MSEISNMYIPLGYTCIPLGYTCIPLGYTCIPLGYTCSMFQLYHGDQFF